MIKCGVSHCYYVPEKGSSFCSYHQPSRSIGGVKGMVDKKDTINPDHYKTGGLETIEIIQAKMTPAQFEGYLLGNILKYTTRYQYKNGVEDLKKSQWYLNKLIQTMESRS